MQKRSKEGKNELDKEIIFEIPKYKHLFHNESIKLIQNKDTEVY